MKKQRSLSNTLQRFVFAKLSKEDNRKREILSSVLPFYSYFYTNDAQSKINEAASACSADLKASLRHPVATPLKKRRAEGGEETEGLIEVDDRGRVSDARDVTPSKWMVPLLQDATRRKGKDTVANRNLALPPRSFA